ncbi:MAG: hypothetical protein AB8B51_02120 [Sedimentitalea sp.]
MSPSEQQGFQFLTVAQAAEKLGESRLRVREAVARGLLEGRRDNEGHLRVTLPDPPTLPEAMKKAPDLPPEDLLGVLFDEVEELESTLVGRDDRLADLAKLLARQDSALVQADQAIEGAQTREARLSELLERALVHLEAVDLKSEKLESVTARAMGHLERTGDALGQTARFDALLERALGLAEQGGDAGVARAADRALGMLDQAMAQAEAGHRASDMLERALDAGERMQDEIGARDVEIAQQKDTIETALAMSERAVSLVDAAPKRSFWQRLFGR